MDYNSWVRKGVGCNGYTKQPYHTERNIYNRWIRHEYEYDCGYINIEINVDILLL